jgi:hypothetical protein
MMEPDAPKSIAAVFAGREGADASLNALSAAGFDDMWLSPATSALSRELVDRGLSEHDAEAIVRESRDGVVIVVRARERADAVTSIFMRFGAKIHTGRRSEAYDARQTTGPAESVAGQADDVDRGSGRGASGGGLGATTGLWPQSAADSDLAASDIEPPSGFHATTREPKSTL